MPEPQSSEMILKAYMFSCKSQAYLWCELFFSVFGQAMRGYFILSFLFLTWSSNILDWLDRQRVIGDLQIQSIIFFFPSKYFQLAFILSILASGTSSFVFLLPLQGILLSGRFSYLFSSYLVISGFLLLILSSPNLHLLFE